MLLACVLIALSACGSVRAEYYEDAKPYKEDKSKYEYGKPEEVNPKDYYVRKRL